MMINTSINFSDHDASIVADVIQQEIYIRSRVKWKINYSDAKYILELLFDKSLDHEERYVVSQKSERCFTIQGQTKRALLYGAGRFMRNLEVSYIQNYGIPYEPIVQLRQYVTFPISSKPEYVWRGHQIAYRPKTHSYDATTVAQMKQEILDQVLFGCNTIEMIPPKLDDCQQSPHFKEPWTERLTAMSEWCDQLGIKTSLWYPAFPGADWHETFKSMKRLDILFIPGGDPGGRVAKELFKIVREHADVAKKYFPNVEVWISSQYGLSASADLKLSAWKPKERLEEFYKEVEANKDILTGLVYGPWTADTSKKFRECIPSTLPIRHYPDLCHNLKSQYIVGPNWDLAFALTYHRESINPRPAFYASAFKHEMPWCVYGAGCYSEGCGDDVNKHVWSALLWEEQDTKSILEDYARWYIGNAKAASIILALELNWQKPLVSGQVLTTLEETLALQAELPRRAETNWRWQMIYFRAVCDAFLYVHQYHQDVNKTCLKWPGQLRSRAVPWETKENKQEVTPFFVPSEMALYGSLQASAAILHALVGMQLDVNRYGSLHEERGGHLDLLRLLPPDDGVKKGNFTVHGLCDLPITTGYDGPILDYADPTHPRVAELLPTLPTRWLSFYSCIWPGAVPLEIQLKVPEGGSQLEIIYIGKDLLLEGGDYEEFHRTAMPVKCTCNGMLLHDYRVVADTTAAYVFPIPDPQAQQLHLVWDVQDPGEVTVRNVPVPVADVRVLSATGQVCEVTG